jgi:hypothetical protein
VTDSSSNTRDWTVLESDLESLAAEAVGILQIGPEIERLSSTLFEQIEVCDAFAASSIDSLFMPTALPLANALIHYAASKPALGNARIWSHERWPDEKDPTRMLATLTLIYIIELGAKTFAGDPERGVTWRRIFGRISTILQEEPRVAAVA